MNYLTLENITKSYGDKILFKNIQLHINKGQKIAFVAKNGTGKSTLLRVLTGMEGSEGENAKIWINSDVQMGFLLQEPQFNFNLNVLETIFDTTNETLLAVKEYEHVLALGNVDQIQAATNKMDDLKAWDVESKVKEIISKLKIVDLEQKIDTLSGGQLKRLALAKILIEEPAFLILDEPTNHLDLDMIEWLEEYLSRPNLTLFMVTHDRYFLERICDTIIELENGQLYKYSGNYSQYLEKKAIRVENEGIEHDKNKKLLRKELDWVRRMPQGRGTKAKSRVDAFYDLKEVTDQKKTEDKMKIEIKGQRLGSKILEAHNVGLDYGDKHIFSNFNYKFKKGERVGIIGKNGTGKSSFLKVLTQELSPTQGKIVVGDTLVFGYYSQDGMELNVDKRVIEVITDIAEYIPLEKGQTLSAAALLERFLFSRSQQQVFVSQLSGGERRRLYLLTILIQNPNFLILDEPTNDLDILTLQILEDFLLDFPGCLLIVTHDRYFMDKLVDHLFVFEGDGQIKDFNGNYSEYRETQNNLPTKSTKTEASSDQEVTPKPSSEGLNYEERKELKRLEKDIEKIQEKIKSIEDRFTNENLNLDDIQKLGVEIQKLRDDLDTRESKWLELAERE
ncbi:MAG: ABC-F family ATP-binding cassette domain-containing protein [Saprospiraceae bacterium]|nr:ABC-F family ATP-binding cassette domain-containing protein [Saprospiraceae bacterium]